jgi:uncharacterized protein
MSTVVVAKRLHVGAGPADVWKVLIQPAAIVECLPGATLLESSDDGLHHTGTVSVTLGPLGVTYRGTADFVEIDSSEHRLRLTARGRERTGAGTVAMTVDAAVLAADFGSDIDLEASVQLTGRIVSLGRGVVDVVMEETLTAFAACLSQKLDAGPELIAAPGERSLAPKLVEPRVGPVGILLRALRTWLRRRFGGG